MKYEEISQLIENRLSEYFKTDTASSNEFAELFDEVLNYSLLAGGKRLRPVLLYKVATDLGLESKISLDFACAMEMIHTYSLIHDDLPAMDDDDYRRGKLTSHVKYSEALAILAGDALLTYAFDLCSNASLNFEHPVRAIKAISKLAEYSGKSGMIIGQVADIESEGMDIGKTEIDFIIENKTGKLIRLVGLIPGILAGMESDNLDKLEKFFTLIGENFQIVDDILDVVGDSSTLGKQAGRDEQLSKNTYVSIYGLENSKAKSNELLSEARNLLEELTFLDKEFFTAILNRLASREN